jgi:hypothetical protein
MGIVLLGQGEIQQAGVAGFFQGQKSHDFCHVTNETGYGKESLNRR